MSKLQITALKYALNTLAAFAPTWLEGILTPEFYERYGQKVEHSKKTRTAVVSGKTVMILMANL